jgi:hypothetical protein
VQSNDSRFDGEREAKKAMDFALNLLRQTPDLLATGGAVVDQH